MRQRRQSALSRSCFAAMSAAQGSAGVVRLALALSVCSPLSLQAQNIFTVSGSNAAAIQSTVDAFRTAVGPLNPNAVGSAGSGRREINWDGVPDALAAPNNLPANFFNVNSPRGVVFSTPGSGFQVSASAGVAPVSFGNLNPTYPSLFTTFSAQRLFTAVGSNITDVNFFIAGSATPAFTTAFGAVFTDVDLLNTTSLQFFDNFNNSLGTYSALNASGNQTLSFLGVQFTNGALISRVRITSGNAVPGANETPTNDVVVMDDFIYAEPILARQVVPEPATLLLLAGGLGALGFLRRQRAV